MKHVDLEQPTFLDQVYLVRTQRERKTNGEIVDEHKNLVESLIMRRSAWTDTASEQRINEQRNKVSTPCVDDHQFHEEELGNGRIIKSLLSHCPRMLSVNCLRKSSHQVKQSQ